MKTATLEAIQMFEAVSNANVGDMASNPDIDFRNGMVSSQMSLTLQVMQM